MHASLHIKADQSALPQTIRSFSTKIRLIISFIIQVKKTKEQLETIFS